VRVTSKLFGSNITKLQDFWEVIHRGKAGVFDK
jgi:hypothetical protein